MNSTVSDILRAHIQPLILSGDYPVQCVFLKDQDQHCIILSCMLSNMMSAREDSSRSGNWNWGRDDHSLVSLWDLSLSEHESIFHLHLFHQNFIKFDDEAILFISSAPAGSSWCDLFVQRVNSTELSGLGTEAVLFMCSVSLSSDPLSIHLSTLSLFYYSEAHTHTHTHTYTVPACSCLHCVTAVLCVSLFVPLVLV